VLVSSPASPARRVAGGWRETHEKLQFYSFGTAAGTLIPAESGSPKPWRSLRQPTSQAV
jgi:hypothetical protein